MDSNVFDDIYANLRSLEIDEIKHRLEPLFRGMVVESPILPTGTFLYRARKIGTDFNKSHGIRLADLTYPPRDKARQGRANRKNQPMFYCSGGKEAVFFELQDLKLGDELVLTFWQATQELLVNNIGYTQRVFEQLGAKRACPTWSPTGGTAARVELPEVNRAALEALMKSDSNREIRSLLSEHFACPIPSSDVERYKLTTAIAEAHLGTIDTGASRFGGLLYPSVRMWANGDNLALLPWFADAHVRFLKAVHIRIDSSTNSTYNISAIDAAREFDADGRLRWLGRILRWEVKPGQEVKFTVMEGRDAYGDYETGANGVPLHYVATDVNTGENLELD